LVLGMWWNAPVAKLARSCDVSFREQLSFFFHRCPVDHFHEFTIDEADAASRNSC
jgi:hypothetical protein